MSKEMERLREENRRLRVNEECLNRALGQFNNLIVEARDAIEQRNKWDIVADNKLGLIADLLQHIPALNQKN